MRTALRTLWDDADGGFRDRAPGGRRHRADGRSALKPLALNCLAARVLSRLVAPHRPGRSAARSRLPRWRRRPASTAVTASAAPPTRSRSARCSSRIQPAPAGSPPLYTGWTSTREPGARPAGVHLRPQCSGGLPVPQPDRSTLVPVLQNIATQLRIDSVRSTTAAGSGHPTTCCSAADIVAALFFAEMRFDPKDPQHPGSDRFVLSKGHAAPILYAAWAEAGLVPARRAAEAARARLGPRRAPDAAAAVRRRGDRIARPGPLRRRRHRAQRAPHRVRLPHLRAARRRRDGRRLGVGSGARSRRTTSSTTSAASPTSTRSARAARRSGSTTWRRSRDAGARSAGTPSSSTATTWTRSSTRFAEARATQRAADDDPRAHAEGQGRLVRRGQGRAGTARPLKKGEEADQAIAELEAQYRAATPDAVDR